MHIELVRQINELPISDLVEIIEEISRGVRREKRQNDRPSLTDEDRSRRKQAVERLRGIAHVPGKIPPTDQEIKKGYADFLAEKYK